MIKVEPCRGCGRTLLVHPVANLSVRLDSEPLDAQTAVQALLDGRNLWRVTQTSVKGARPAELSALRTAEPGERPFIAAEHRCPQGAPSRLRSTPEVSEYPKGPPSPPAAPSRPSSGPTTDSSTPGSVLAAGTQGGEPFQIDWSKVGETVVCSVCSRAIDVDATDSYAMIELGAALVDAFHTGECPGR